MDIETLRRVCLALPHATEDVKWGADLCFCIGEKMFCVTGLQGDFGVSLKVKDEEFDTLTETDNIRPAAYVARYKWVSIDNPARFTQKEWEHYIRQSYELVKAKLPKKLLKELGG